MPRQIKIFIAEDLYENQQAEFAQPSTHGSWAISLQK
jgi:hypothetical protein